MIRAHPLKGQWQVPGRGPSSADGLMGLMHINELGGREWVALRYLPRSPSPPLPETESPPRSNDEGAPSEKKNVLQT